MRLFFLVFTMIVCSPKGVLGSLSEVDRALLTQRNLLLNGGFESGKASWTASAGTFATTTTTPAVGNQMGTWDASATSQTLTSSSVSIPAGMYGLEGTLSCLFKCASGTCTHTIGLWDGTTLTGTKTITSSTSVYQRSNVTFTMPSSGTAAIRITSAKDEPLLNIDDCYLGATRGGDKSLRMGIATFGGTGSASSRTNCVSPGPCVIYYQSSPWLSSVSWISTGKYTMNFASNYFSSPPVCMTKDSAQANVTVCVGSFSGYPSTTSYTIECFSGALATTHDSTVDVMCVGEQ